MAARVATAEAERVAGERWLRQQDKQIRASERASHSTALHISESISQMEVGSSS